MLRFPNVLVGCLGAKNRSPELYSEGSMLRRDSEIEELLKAPERDPDGCNGGSATYRIAA